MMTITKTMLNLLTFLLFACNGQPKSELRTENEFDTIEEIKSDTPSEKDFSNSAHLFAQEILRENLRTHSFDLSNDNNPKFLNIFCSEAIETIIAYSDKNYPKNIEPENYEHFVLFVATYKSVNDSKNCFDQLKADLKLPPDDIEESTERAKLLTYGAKSGGMITQNGRQVFSLVKTCRETPIGGTWLNYENKFLQFITESEEEIVVLNSKCGMNKYQIEERRTRR